MAELNAVVDLSYHNGLVTFAKAKKTGLLGAIHKATQGTQYPDPKIRSIDLGAANDPVLIQLLVLASADATVTNLVETPVRWRNSEGIDCAIRSVRIAEESVLLRQDAGDECAFLITCTN